MSISDASPEAMRPGERAVGTPPREDATLTFIGRIETPWRTRGECPRQGDPADGPDCRLHLDPMWEPALAGIDALPRLQVLYWMHQARRDLVRLVPRSHEDATPRGPFALRAPTRPNPIASTVVTLIGRAGTVLTVRGLDCLNGTPLLDLKPWRGR